MSKTIEIEIKDYKFIQEDSRSVIISYNGNRSVVTIQKQHLLNIDKDRVLYMSDKEF